MLCGKCTVGCKNEDENRKRLEQSRQEQPSSGGQETIARRKKWSGFNTGANSIVNFFVCFQGKMK
jgi:hypothetical protein